jgi:ABC-2 type transport system permease protein
MNASLGMSRGRLGRAYLIDTKYEFIRTIRSPIVYVSLLVMPVGMYTFLSVVLAGARDLPVDIRTPQQAGTFANWIVFALMGPAMMSFGIGVAGERQTGVMTFKRALPMPPFAFLLSKLLSVAMFACVVIALMTAVNVLFTQANLTVAQHVRLFGAGSLLVLPFCALGLAVGASLPVAAAFAFANLGWTGLAMLGGLLFPVPGWLAMWTPTYYAGQLNRGIVGLPTDVPAWTSVVVLTALTVIFGSLAINRINAANDD